MIFHWSKLNTGIVRITSPSRNTAPKNCGAKMSRTPKIMINTIPAILSPLLIIAFLWGIGDRFPGVHIFCFPVKLSPRSLTVQFFSFFISKRIFLRSMTAKASVTPPKADSPARKIPVNPLAMPVPTAIIAAPVISPSNITIPSRIPWITDTIRTVAITQVSTIRSSQR